MRRFFRRGRLDAERAREMQAHIDHLVDDLIARGYTRDRALREARRRFGNPTAVREELYRMNTVPVFEPLLRDLRYAFRMLRKTPGFTIAATLTLALGIGANAAVFSAVNALLFEPLPYRQPDRLAIVGMHYRSAKNGDAHELGSDGRMWLAARDHVSKIDVAVFGGTSGVNLVAAENVAYVEQQRVSAGYFRVLGSPLMIGREFSPEEDRSGGQPVVILSYDLWRRLFSSDRGVIGKPVRLRGESYTVIGVAPRDFPSLEGGRFDGGTGIDLWTPLKPSTSGEGGGTNYEMIARLRDGVSWAEAQNDVRGASPDAFVNVPPGDVAELELVPMQAGMTAEIRQPLLMLWGAVGIVLLIACVNIAGLVLARGATRTREIATRLALGSGRRAVIRQLLVESAVLALLGGALGLLIAWGAITLLGSLGARVFNLWEPLTLNAPVLLATLAIALATSVVFGLAPALQASRLDVQAALAETGARGVAGASSRWPRRFLVIGEVALGMVLLVGAGLLIRTFVHLRTLDPGFNESNLLTASVSLQDARYKEPQAVGQLFDDSIARLRAVPGVQNAGVALGMPYSRLLNVGVRRLDGPHIDEKGHSQITNEVYVTPGFFETLEAPMRAGRTLGSADTAASQPVALVNEAFVGRYYKDDPHVIGRHIGSGSTSREIVGIVGNTQQGSAGWGHFGPISPLPCVYIPVTQVSSDFLTMVHTWFQPSWVVRSSLNEASVVAELRKAIGSVDPLLPIASFRTIDDLRGEKLSSQRFMMWLVAGLGLTALVLAGVGLHGLIASSVNERTRELGIRLALGATARQAVTAVVIPGLVLAAAGVAIGTAAAFASARLLHSFVWGVTPTDPATFVGVIAVLMAIALVASLLPALRVLRLDPAATLRAE